MINIVFDDTLWIYEERKNIPLPLSSSIGRSRIRVSIEVQCVAK